MAGMKFFFGGAKRQTAERKEAQEVGVTGEELAARYLTDQGLTVVERNYRNGRHEIDIVALEGDELVVVEVKTRTSRWLEPEEAVDRSKRLALIEAANQYVLEQHCTRPVRFDVVGIVHGENGPEVNHIRNAFDMFSL
ncbi:MAG: YraN family protein [Bacteroidales bacterium]|nr:YraN family protein [Bacteroidales bacterium]